MMKIGKCVGTLTVGNPHLSKTCMISPTRPKVFIGKFEVKGGWEEGNVAFYSLVNPFFSIDILITLMCILKSQSLCICLNNYVSLFNLILNVLYARILLSFFFYIEMCNVYMSCCIEEYNDTG